MLKYMLMFGSLLFCSTFVFAAPFTDNSNDTVTDHATGLVWQQTDNATSKLWQNALNYCNALSLAGSNDWRLPDIKELRSILDESLFDPAIDPVFVNTNASLYWSSSSQAGSPGNAWTVDFRSGSVNPSNKTYWNYVRCVR